MMFGTGTGVRKDEAQAHKLFERAARGRQPARRDQSRGRLRLGGAAGDPGRTRAMLMRAADTNPEAQYQLGLMMADGIGGPQGRCRRTRAV